MTRIEQRHGSSSWQNITIELTYAEAVPKLEELRAANPDTGFRIVPHSKTISATIEQLNTVWRTICDEGDGGNVFGSLLYLEAVSIADVLLSAGFAETAGRVMRAWVESDDDWEEHDGDGTVSAYLSLIEPEAGA